MPFLDLECFLPLVIFGLNVMSVTVHNKVVHFEIISGDYLNEFN